MKTLLTIIFTLSQVWGQSVNASLTIYKDGFGLVKQPVSWNVNAGSNTVKYDRIADGMFAETPFLDLQKAEVHTQRLNRNIFSSNNLFQSQLGQKVKVKLAGEKTVSGILIEYNANCDKLFSHFINN